MDILLLPVATMETTVGQALQSMNKAQKSGIAQKRGNYIALYCSGELNAKDAREDMPLSEFGTFRLALMVSEDAALQFGLPPRPEMPMTLDVLNAIERFLFVRGHFFAVFGPVKNEARVVSISEDGMRPFNTTPDDCFCLDPFTTHSYRTPHPPSCWYDGSQIKCK